MDESRRRICKAGLALGAAAIVPGCGSAAKQPTCTLNAYAVGYASDVAMNAAVMRMTPEMNIFVCHDKNGYYALDAGCTHLGCDVSAVNAADVSKGFACPCHGATYDANGLKPTSPAPTPLQHYQLCVQPSGTLLVDFTQPVDATVRLKI